MRIRARSAPSRAVRLARAPLYDLPAAPVRPQPQARPLLSGRSEPSRKVPRPDFRTACADRGARFRATADSADETPQPHGAPSLSIRLRLETKRQPRAAPPRKLRGPFLTPSAFPAPRLFPLRSIPCAQLLPPLSLRPSSFRSWPAKFLPDCLAPTIAAPKQRHGRRAGAVLVLRRLPLRRQSWRPEKTGAG